MEIKFWCTIQVFKAPNQKSMKNSVYFSYCFYLYPSRRKETGGGQKALGGTRILSMNFVFEQAMVTICLPCKFSTAHRMC